MVQQTACPIRGSSGTSRSFTQHKFANGTLCKLFNGLTKAYQDHLSVYMYLISTGVCNFDEAKLSGVFADSLPDAL